MKTVIFVNRSAIGTNKRHGTHIPPIHARSYKGSKAGHCVLIKDRDGNEVARLGYWPETPLPCGATVWIETMHDVEVLTAPTTHEGSRP